MPIPDAGDATGVKTEVTSDTSPIPYDAKSHFPNEQKSIDLSILLDGLIDKLSERGDQTDFSEEDWIAKIKQQRTRYDIMRRKRKRKDREPTATSRFNYEIYLGLGSNAGKWLKPNREDGKRSKSYKGLCFRQVRAASFGLRTLGYGRDIAEDKLPILGDRDTWGNVFKAALADVERQIKRSNEGCYSDPEPGLRSPRPAPDSGTLPHPVVAPVGSGAPDTSLLVPLQWDASAEPKDVPTKYASLTLRTGNFPPDSTVGRIHLGFDLHCPEHRIDTLVTALNRCLLTFDCAGGHTVPMAERTGNGGGTIFDRARFSTYGTSIFTPSWTINATGPGGIGKVESIPATFIQIDGLRPGSSVKAEIAADVKELGSTFVLPEGEGQSEARKMIKKRLRQLEIVGGDDGMANFAVSEFKLMAKPDANE
jgi:hypothetical protein